MGQQTSGLIINNEAEFRKALLSMPVAMRQKGANDAVVKGARVVANKAKSLAPKETGALKKSISQVLRNRNSKIKDPYSVIGPRKGVFGQDSSGKKYPANYAHLVEFGHHIVQIGTGTLYDNGSLNRQTKRKTHKSKIGLTGQGVATQFILGRPFLRPAFETTKTVVQTVMAAALGTYQQRAGAAAVRKYLKAKGRI